jgi:hypothetical protein
MILLPTSDHEGFLAVCRLVVNQAETVDSYYVDYTDPSGLHIDAEYLGRERVDHVLRTLAELDEITRQGGAGGDSEIGHLSRVTVERASYLAAAIREVLISRPVKS